MAVNQLTQGGTGKIVIDGGLTGDLVFTDTGLVTLGDDVSDDIDGDVKFRADGRLDLGVNSDVSGSIYAGDGGNPLGNLGVQSVNVLTQVDTTDGRLNGVYVLKDGLDFNNDVGDVAVYLGIDVVGTVTISGDQIIDIGFEKDGTVTLEDGANVYEDGASIGGDITTNVNNQGTLTLSGSSTIDGDVGESNKKLADINAGANGSSSSFGGDVYATNMDITGTGSVTLNGDSRITTMNFAGDGSLSIANARTLEGNVTTDTANTGTLIFEGDGAVTGNVGALGAGNELKLVTVNAGDVTTDGDIAATTVNFSGDGSLSVADGHTLEGNVTTGAADTGKLIFEGAGTMTGDIGNRAGNKLNLVQVNSGTVTTSGDIAAKRVSFVGDGVLDVGGDATLDSVTNTTLTNSMGKLILNGTSSVSGNTGAAGAMLREIEMDVALTAATFGGDVYASTTTMNSTGSVQFNGNVTSNIIFRDNGNVNLATGKNITGTVTTDTDDRGTLNFKGDHTTGGNIGESGRGLARVNIERGTLVMAHDIAASEVRVNSAAGGAGTLTVSGNRTIYGDLTVLDSGVLNLGANTLTLDGAGAGSGSYNQQAGSTLVLAINGATVFGNIVGAGNAVVAANSTVNVNVVGQYIPDGTTFRIIDGAGGAGVNVPTTLIDNSGILKFTLSSSGDDLILTANRTNTYATFAADGNAAAAGAALEEAGKNGATGDMQTVLNTLDSMSEDQIAAALDTMIPDPSGGSIAGSRAVANQFMNTVGARLGYARNGLVGLSTGDAYQGTGFWMQGLGQHADQGTRKGIAGYRMNAFGTAIGVDKAVSDHMRLGIAAGYGYTDVKSKAAGSPSTDINSWQGAIYAGYDARTKQEQARMHQETGRLRTPVCRNFYYVDSLFAFTQNNYDTRRNVFLGDTTRTAKGEYNGQQYSTSIEAGYTMNLKGTGALEITPFTTLDYAFLYLHDYTEKGADALNLHVEGEGYNLLTQGWGMKFAYPFRTKKHGTYIPSLRAAWVFDYLTDKFSSTSSFAGGGTSFTTKGVAPARSALLLGFEMAFLNRGHFTLTGNYDLEIRDEYISNTYYVTLRYEF